MTNKEKEFNIRTSRYLDQQTLTPQEKERLIQEKLERAAMYRQALFEREALILESR